MYRYIKARWYIDSRSVFKRAVEKFAGGPANIELLYSIDDLLQDFSGLQIVIGLEEETVILDEGPFHKGTANVVRVVGRRIIDHLEY